MQYKIGLLTVYVKVVFLREILGRIAWFQPPVHFARIIVHIFDKASLEVWIDMLTNLREKTDEWHGQPYEYSNIKISQGRL